VMTTYNLWRTGVAAVAINEEDDGDASWGKPVGEREELEKEKRTLLKAIKEAEFDHAMGKLSKRDVDEMIATYRARAIEVIKEIERLDAGEAGTVKERIEREVKARLELVGKADAKVKKANAKKDKDGKVEKAEAAKPEATEATEAATDKAEPAEPAKPAEAKAEAKPAEAKPAETKPAEARPAEAKSAEAKSAEADVVPPVATAVDAGDARDAKEATP
jgi:hypothetical protein